MPAITSESTNGVAAAKSAPPAVKRFELPVLDFKFGSLTDGTDIPPPLPSPVQEVPTPPKTPTETDLEKTKATNGHSNGHNGVKDLEVSPQSDMTSTTNGLRRSVDEGPVSPTHSNRGSLRRLLSRTLLNNTYDEQASGGGQGASRPPSRMASTISEERKSKRSSGWFRRLRSHESGTASKRNSTQFEDVKKAGPPPPMIPELSAWNSEVDTTIGDDLFKEIK